MRHFLSRIALLTSILIVMGTIPLVGLFKSLSVQAEVLLPNSCDNVTASVYVAVYSRDTGQTTCYLNDRIVLSPEMGDEFDVTLKSNLTIDTNYAFISQQGARTPGHIMGGKYVFPTINTAVYGNELFVNLYESYYDHDIHLKPHGSIVYPQLGDFEEDDVYDNGNLILSSLQAGSYDITYSEADDSNITLISGNETISPIAINGVAFFREVEIAQNGHVFLNVGATEYEGESGVEYEYEDAFYIGYVPEDKTLVKVRFVNDEISRTEFQVHSVDNISITSAPASNVLFFQETYPEDEGEVGSEFFKYWEHQINVDVKEPAHSKVNYLITSNIGHSFSYYSNRGYT